MYRQSGSRCCIDTNCTVERVLVIKKILVIMILDLGGPWWPASGLERLTGLASESGGAGD